MVFFTAAFLLLQVVRLSFQQPSNMHAIDTRSVNDWSNTLPFNRELKLATPYMNGKDVTILQNLLRRHSDINLTATSHFDERTKNALKTFSIRY